MAAAARVTPIVDGSGLKHTLERETIRWLQREGVIDFRGRRVLMVAGVDRFGMAEALAEAGADLLFGDLVYGLGINVPVRGLKQVNRLARMLLPVICWLPISWLYLTGKQLEQRHLETSIGETFPIATTMREEIGRLREWARHRTRPASSSARGGGAG